MLIRAEIPIDAAKIDHLLTELFLNRAEADLVCQLRENGLLTLGMVATDDSNGEVVGYTAFCPVSVGGKELNWLALAILVVNKHYQNQDIDQQLVLEGLETLNEFGYTAVVALGDAEFYQKLGFLLAKDKGLSYHDPQEENQLFVYPLTDDALSAASGEVIYPFSSM